MQLVPLLVAYQLLFGFNRVAAQSSLVVCPATYDWASNSLNQNPCVVAAFLLRPCSATAVEVPPLPLSQHYSPGDSSDCNCNTVIYSLISACADCQLRQYSTWSGWNVNCSSVYRSIYPHNIPTGTAVPGWAYLDVVGSNNFDPNLAASANLPEVAAGSPPGSLSLTRTSSAGSSRTASPSSSSRPKSSVQIGPIVGGAVGGVVVIGAIVGGVIWFISRRKRQSGRGQHDGGSEYAVQITPMPPPPKDGVRPPIDDMSYPAYQFTPVVAPVYPTPKLYDPSDPSTFPTAMDPPFGPPYAPTSLSTGANSLHTSSSPPPASMRSSTQPYASTAEHRLL